MREKGRRFFKASKLAFLRQSSLPVESFEGNHIFMCERLFFYKFAAR